jgi:type IV pilus assembly protein PilM
VEYFNPLRNVAVGPRINVEQVGAEAHTLGELVGLALREMACPMELDLAPHSVKAAKDVGAKKPRLFIAAACLFAGLGSIYVYNSSAAGAIGRETGRYQAEVDKLIKYDAQIKDQQNRQKVEETRADYLRSVINERSFWVNLMNGLNAQFTDEKIWITQVSMVGPKGEQTVEKLFSNGWDYPFATGVKTAAPSGPKPTTMGVTALHVTGINRGSVEEVPLLLKKIQDNLKDYFEFPAGKSDDELRNDFVINAVGGADTKAGYDFQLLLPLKRKMEVPLTVAPGTKK